MILREAFAIPWSIIRAYLPKDGAKWWTVIEGLNKFMNLPKVKKIKGTQQKYNRVPLIFRNIWTKLQ